MQSTTANNNKHLRISNWNSRGFSAAIPYLRELLDASDIVTVCEHWLHKNQLFKLSDVNNEFLCHGRSSKAASDENFGIRRGSGGVAIYWRKNLSGISPLLNIDHDRVCGIRMQTANNAVINVLSVYMPAAGSVEGLAPVLDELSCIIESLDEGSINIITGDLNGDIGAEGGPRSSRPPTRAGKAVLNFLRKYEYVAANLLERASGSLPTFTCHNGSSTIDYVLVPKAYIDNVISCYTEADHVLNTSDHYPIKTTLCINNFAGYTELTKGNKSIRWDKVTPEQVKEIYENSLRGMLSDIPIDPNDDLLSGEQIDDLILRVIEFMHLAAKRLPRSKYVSHLKPYWSEELSILKREKMFWFKLWKQEGRTLNNEDPTRINMKISKKIFHKRIKALSRKYDNDLISEAANLAEVDRDGFWRLFKRMKGSTTTKVHAVKNAQDQVVYDIDSVLGVWRSHFSNLSVPRESDAFDRGHYDHITRRVSEWAQGVGVSPFLEDPFTIDEIVKAINKLHLKKTPGHDRITAEHLRYGGFTLYRVIAFLFNMCVRVEYIPINFRMGIQVPLYKGKNTCPLSPDNYRGITLLSSFNKLFEMVIWLRLEPWWENTRIISELQGACRKGSSCVHTALTLQETIACQRERGKKVFVAFFDVSKAFDSVWIDGLFFQLHELGVKDSLWRLLYKCYIGFSCCVRIGDRTSLPYPMRCGIHQGGYLSLVKYITFINSLIVELKTSRLCCSIGRVQTTPLGYADDLATCTLSGNNMHNVLNIVARHGRTWRYSFNAKKSAIMVFGENKAEAIKGKENRMFLLGNDKVKESLHYDHVGIKTCVNYDTHIRTEEKIKKARTTLNMATCMGIKRGGLNIMTCCIIYWTVVVPTLCFGCELWILSKKDIQLLQGFQRYAARRIQRLHPRSLNLTSRLCLGWLDIVRYIMMKKALFIRTVIVMKEYIPVRSILLDKIDVFPIIGNVDNKHNSPINDLLNTCAVLNLVPQVKAMANGPPLSKAQWKKLVHARTWDNELDEWQNLDYDGVGLELLNRVSLGPDYSIWWQLSDSDHRMMKKCETMVRILCKATYLKDDDCRLKGQPLGSRMCIRCDLGAMETAVHMIMECPANLECRTTLNAEMNDIAPDIEPHEMLNVALGKVIDGWNMDQMRPIWEVSAKYITQMYTDTLRARQGIG